MYAFFQKLDAVFARVVHPLKFAIWFLTRLGVGVSFFFHGKKKFGDLSGTAKFFDSLGIPLSNLQAPLVAGIELAGGILLVLGLATRPVAALLCAVMVVALLTAHNAQLGQAMTFDGAQQFADIGAFAYLLLLLLIWVYGPGRVSVDAMMLDCPTGESPQRNKRS